VGGGGVMWGWGLVVNDGDWRIMYVCMGSSLCAPV
jgi:hypothetical protein